jgi:hypothetical protein
MTVHRSPAQVLTEHQELHEGDVLLGGPNCDAATGAWRGVALDPPQSLVPFSRRTLSGREVLPGRAWPRSYFACSWALVLRPSDPGGTRLIDGTRIDYHPPWVVGVVDVIRSGDTVMQRNADGIKRRVEATSPGTFASVAGAQ